LLLENGTVLNMTPGHPVLTLDGWKSMDVENSLQEHETVVTLLSMDD
jgi:hypothetical protein